MYAAGWTPPGGSEGVLSVEELNALIADAAVLSALDPYGRPLPAVLDTGFVRSGLEDQLKRGKLPASVWSAQEGSLRLFMEYDTLIETGEKLPKFASQLGVTVTELRRMFNRDWLPNIEVVRLPLALCGLDPRALLVRDRDPDDFPAASLAGLLSPCLLLTRDLDFSALGIRTQTQGRDGVLALIDVKVGEVRLQAVVAVPALPLRAAGAAMNWATGKIGGYAWVILGLVVAGGVYWYSKQPPERRDNIKKVATSIGAHVMNEYGTVAGEVDQARVQLRACMVPKPQHSTSVSAIMRELARSRPSRSPRLSSPRCSTSGCGRPWPTSAPSSGRMITRSSSRCGGAASCWERTMSSQAEAPK